MPFLEGISGLIPIRDYKCIPAFSAAAEICANIGKVKQHKFQKTAFLTPLKSGSCDRVQFIKA
jgi:hypothetical protein